ncbi:eukaryotic aspartyl protease family protein [Striga asiatica]|uniref:Eukaryotic aspartyl protease family protein n=1 Tax=Striga asiatica TaxID=4170 RepID=A0A5A7PWR7_STRAF|nr:eukaryotic aspartyl protease family protein [Striga asiatica]
MEAKQIVFFFLLFTVVISVSSDPPQYQTFFPTSLPQVSHDLETLSWDIPKQFSDSHSESETPPIVVRLHHADHLSPSSNSTPESLFLNRLQRDAVRARTIACRKPQNFRSFITSGFSIGSSEYVTLIGVGTPATQVYMTIDTGSDVTWLQCQPCPYCYPQQGPIFNPKSSTSFASVHCNSPLCTLIGPLGCRNPRDKCQYRLTHGDEYTTSGELSTETLTFGATKLPQLPIGCGHNNEGSFAGAGGLLGLGQGKLSFPAQARINKLSYCLVEPGSKSGSYLIFGESPVSGKTVFITPLLTNPEIDTYYYVELIGISVGGTRVRGIGPSVFKLNSNGSGGVIVDSSTSVTRLVQPAYNALRDAFKAQASHLKPAKADRFSTFDTCYEIHTDVNVPTVALNFRGADVPLQPSNILTPVDNKGRYCFAFAEATDGLSIIGNIQQKGFRDLAATSVNTPPIIFNDRPPDTARRRRPPSLSIGGTNSACLLVYNSGEIQTDLNSSRSSYTLTIVSYNDCARIGRGCFLTGQSLDWKLTAGFRSSAHDGKNSMKGRRTWPREVFRR